MNRQLYLRIAFLLPLLMAPAMLTAQQSKPAGDVAVAPEGTQVATEQTAAAAANTNSLQKATQNPVASLISVPIQNNSNFGVQPGDRTQDVLNIQPVIPISASKDWNLVIRWIMPIVYQPLPNQSSPTQTGVYGFGDMQPTFFLVPKKTSKLIWGAGPIVQIPTATSDYLGQGQAWFGAIGGSFDAAWSLDDRRAGEQCVVRGGFGWKAGSESIPDAILHQLQPEKGLVPQHGSHRDGKLGILQRQSMDGALRRRSWQDHEARISAGQSECNVLRNAVHPTGTSSWNMRLQIALLFPKLTKQQQMMLMEQRLKQLKAEPSHRVRSLHTERRLG